VVTGQILSRPSIDSARSGGMWVRAVAKVLSLLGV
jgi:hypothetical protein